jgi:hypothetical protein
VERKRNRARPRLSGRGDAPNRLKRGLHSAPDPVSD